MTNSVLSGNKKQFPCPSCGASLNFNPQADKLKCPYCGWEDQIPQSETEVQERSYEEYLKSSKSQLTVLSSTAMEIRCSGCSANVTFDPPHVAGECPFCGTPIVNQPKAANPTMTPEGIVVFKIGQKEARDNIQKWLGSGWFTPNSLKKLAQQEKIQGVYLPFWTYDAQTHSFYKGERGEHYYETETYTETNDKGERETKTRQIQKTHWDSASGRVSRFFDDVLIPSTKLVNRYHLDQLEPWDLKTNLRPYEPSYLAGFQAQQSQVSLEEGFEDAKNVMAKTIECDVRRDIGGDEQRVHSVSTNYSAITFKHILLPIWLSSYRFNNKQYQVLVNAMTGEVQGDLPLSYWKVGLAISVGVAIVGVIIYLMAR